MKDFDERRRERAARDRGFTLGGEQFVMKPGVRPEILVAYEGIPPEATPEQKIGVLDGVIIGFLEDEAEATVRWTRARAIEDNPVTLQDMQDLIEWLIEQQTGRPTGQPSVSSPGGGGTVTPLTAASSSPVAAGGSNP